MSLRFRGGELLQRGRGIGGMLRRLFNSLFSPILKTAGKSITKAATSNTAKTIGNAVKDQLLLKWNESRCRCIARRKPQR